MTRLFYSLQFRLVLGFALVLALALASVSFYVGYAGGYVGGRLQAYGTVRRCLLSEEHCGHEVGVDNPVRGLTPHGSGASRVVWVLDSLGSLTPLADALFDATPTTSGTDPAGKFDGTGGCVTWDGFFDWIAEPCPSAASIGMAGSELGFLP